MLVVSLYITWIIVAVTPCMTAMYTAFAFKFLSSPVSIMFIAIF